MTGSPATIAPPGPVGVAGLPTMAYCNGGFVPYADAALPVEDRGTLFGDGVYEVVTCHGGRFFAAEAHTQRLRRSLEGIRLPAPAAVDELVEISGELLERQAFRDARVYWQITRGSGPRNHLPPVDAEPSIVVLAYPDPPLVRPTPLRTWRAILQDDCRWSNCWIKSLMLLPNTLAKQQAHQAGCQEAIFHRDGVVTEGSASNVIAVRGGELWTHPANRWILSGTTRDIVLRIAKELGIAVHETALDVPALLAADEVFVTGTTTRLAAITHIDGQPIGSTTPGPITRRLHDAYLRRIVDECHLA